MPRTNPIRGGDVGEEFLVVAEVVFAVVDGCGKCTQGGRSGGRGAVVVVAVAAAAVVEVVVVVLVVVVVVV